MDYQTIQEMTPKNGNLHRNLMLGEGKVTRQRGNLSARRKFYKIQTTCQTNLQDETEAQTMMGPMVVRTSP